MGLLFACFFFLFFVLAHLTEARANHLVGSLLCGKGGYVVVAAVFLFYFIYLFFSVFSVIWQKV